MNPTAPTIAYLLRRCGSLNGDSAHGISIFGGLPASKVYPVNMMRKAFLARTRSAHCSVISQYSGHSLAQEQIDTASFSSPASP